MEKNYKSVSKLLDKGYGSLNYRGKRGRLVHEVITKFYKKILKTADRNRKLNYRVLSQRVSKVKSDILTDIRKNQNYEIYYEDAKVLLNALQSDILRVAKGFAKDNYQIVIPREIEKGLFGGEVSFEISANGKVGGLRIPARVDCLIELESDRIIIRDFKSYDYNNKMDPINPDSQDHRAFMQVCLYAIIFERERHQKCETIQLQYFPNKIISYELTEELKKTAKKFAMDTAFEGFEGIKLDFSSEDENQIEDQIGPIEDRLNLQAINQTDSGEDFGWINTIKGKPLELNLGKDNSMEGFLKPDKAHLLKDGYCVVVEKEEDGTRIMCVVKKIECSEDLYSGETSSHKEENYKITLIPVGQFTPEGYEDLRPQTIIGGKIKKPTEWELKTYWKIPQNGIEIGNIQGLNTGIRYPIDIKTLYQSVFISGQQGTGKTTALKSLMLQMVQEKNSPAIINLDNEGEYYDLGSIPSNKKSKDIMEKYGIRKLNPSDINFVTIGTENGYCLTLKAIDPIDLPNFLHELTPISHDTLQTIIYDIMENNKEIEFTLPELRKYVFRYLEKETYGALKATKSAIKRAMNSISLRIFDVPGLKSIDFESMLKPGKITIVNSYNLRDSHQRIVGLYLLAILHKRALKSKEKIRVIFILDEIQRLIPKAKSQADSDYHKRIIKFLDEVVHRGRKRDYGVLFATQSVMDVKKEIIDLCNTKIFFQTQGSGVNYLKEYFSHKEDLERLKRLYQGHAYITSKGIHEPVEIKFPFLN